MNSHVSSAPNYEPTDSSKAILVYWILIGFVTLFVVFVRVRLLTMPLERDEGEYAYTAQLLLKGYAPFDKAYNMKFPGTSIMYALIIGVFGQSAVGVHLGLLLINLCTIILLFAAMKQFFNALVAFVGASTFALLSLSPPFLGSAAHATHFVVFFVIAGLFVLQKSFEESEKQLLVLSLGGLLLGMGIVMKQPGAAFALFAVFALFSSQLFVVRTSFPQALKRTGVFTLGVILPVLILLLWLAIAGVFERFWFWTVEYGSQYASARTWAEGRKQLEHFLTSSFNEYSGVWIFSLVGTATLTISGFTTSKKIFIATFAAISFLAVCPGFYFRAHYFILLLPSLGLLAGIGAEVIQRIIAVRLRAPKFSWLPSAIFLTALVVGVVRLQSYHLGFAPGDVAKVLYSGNPFQESVAVADYIRQNTQSHDRIAVLGSEPEVYFYSNRISASGYLYTYGLMEPQQFNNKMQSEMIGEIEKSKPRMLVYYRVNLSWLVRPESPKAIFTWLENYVTAHYQLTGIVELPGGASESSFFWDEQARTHRPSTGDAIFIFMRNEVTSNGE